MLSNFYREQQTACALHTQQHAAQISQPEALAGGALPGNRYRNFVLLADYSDPDVIRVGEDYYAVSSTFHLEPGITILHSRDLVQWEIIGHAIRDLSKLSQDFSPSSMNGYGDGVWAVSLRYHAGMFYLHVGGPKIGLIVCKSASITGEWQIKRMRMHTPWQHAMLIDCCPFWDDDGTAYFTATETLWHQHRTGYAVDYKMHLFQMAPDGESLLDNGVVIHGGRLTEASKIYKIDGYYYIFYCEHPLDECGRRTQFAMRSRTIYGPFERKKLLHSHHPDSDMLASQGGLVQAADGGWWFLCHGMADEAPLAALGRPLALLPVRWVDGWPILGQDADGDGVGEFVWEAARPVQNAAALSPATSDDFNSPVLGQQWQFNHSARNDMWSLTQRPGHLRLHACKPCGPGGFYHACNTLTQRICGERSVIETKIHVAYMADGQFSGLCLLTQKSRLIGVYQDSGQKYIRKQYTRFTGNDAPPEDFNGSVNDDFFATDLALCTQDILWLRCEIVKNSAKLFYSLDGTHYTDAEEAFTFTQFAWRGARIGLFSFNEYRDAGSIDVEYFHRKA